MQTFICDPRLVKISTSSMANTVFVLLFMVASSLCFVFGDEKSEMLLDFTTLPSLRGWIETSDLIRRVGKSKAVFVLQRTKVFQRAVLFTMLNPQPDGAGYAGFRTDTNFNLTQWTSLQLRCRGQGDHHGYKIALRHRSETDPKPSYELMFQAPTRKFDTVTLPLIQFEPYHRGRRQPSAPPLDTSLITSLQLQTYGGVFLPVKQTGTASLEIDWIKAV